MVEEDKERDQGLKLKFVLRDNVGNADVRTKTNRINTTNTKRNVNLTREVFLAILAIRVVDGHVRRHLLLLLLLPLCPRHFLRSGVHHRRRRGSGCGGSCRGVGGGGGGSGSGGPDDKRLLFATNIDFVIETRNESLKSVMRLKAVHVEIGNEIDDANRPSHKLRGVNECLDSSLFINQSYIESIHE